MSSQFRYGANFEFLDKTGADKLSHARAWRQAEGSFTDLAAHISRGRPWMPALLDKNSRREKSAANYAEIIAADIDDGWPIEQAIAHPFVAAHCGLGVESASSSPEMPKFRLVFRLTAPVEGFELIELANRYLIYLLQSDAACKDASRFFFGAQGRSPFLLNESAVLPADFLDQAAMWQSEQEAALERDRQARAKLAAQWAAESPDSDQQRLKDIEEALSCIAPYKPGEGRYSDLLRAIAGVLNELGDAGRSLLLSWDGGRGEWGKSFDRKLDSIAKGSGKATLGSLFYLAKSEGWKPQRAIQSSSKPARKSAAALYPPQQLGEGSGKPEKQSKATLSFADAMAAIAQTYAEIESEAEQAWELGAIARKTGRRLPELLKIYELWEGEKRGFEPLAIEEFLTQKNPDTEWLIGDFLPAKTTGILYGDGGAGKSLFVYDLVKAIATGSDFCDRPTRQGKVLILQSDEPSGVTRERLSTAGFEGVPAETVWIERGWKSGQMRRLRQWLEKYSPDLVVIDSLAAIHRSSDSDENDAGYARLFFDLRDLQEQYGCTILMLHHANKAGGARGTSAIFDNVSEVFHLRKPSKEDKGLIDLDRVLEIPKTRVPRTTTKLVFRLNPDNYSWDERPNLEERPATLSDRLLAFLRLPNQRGVWIEPEELLQYTTIGGNRDTIRKALAGLARAGLVEAADRQGDRGRPYKVYRVPPTEGSQLAIDPDELPANPQPVQPESPPVTPAPVAREPQPPPDEAIATLQAMLAAAESDEERDELLRDAIACGLPVELIGGCHDFRL